MSSLQLAQRLAKEVGGTKVARFECECDRLVVQALGPGHARIDLRANPEAADPKGSHNRARRLTARDDELAHTGPNQALADTSKCLLDQGTGAFDAELALHGLYLLRCARRKDKDRSRSQVLPGPGKRLLDDRLTGGELARIDAKSRSCARPLRDLGVGRK